MQDFFLQTITVLQYLCCEHLEIPTLSLTVAQD